MNKQEAIEKIKNIETLNINDIIAGQSVDMVIKNQVLDIISQIDEPQKVVVPKFVAEWLEYCKSSYRDLQTVLSRLDDDRKVGDWAYDEDDNLMSEKVDMIARAWVDGYEIEQDVCIFLCANCQSEILDEEYLMIRDNFLLVKYFDDPDGLDNIFCSEHCICESLSVAGVEIVEE
ncbi:DUF1642 domain-containing protein [Streptococcus parasuis]|uniref:DUF1642 domain-containing protein n=1 Tax=Streptococcus parasuis TaxID=1501662 RepID=UPI0028B04F00|nr:DUF1642 domain-containing protein [Streptococcus parasuis]